MSGGGSLVAWGKGGGNEKEEWRGTYWHCTRCCGALEMRGLVESALAFW